METRKIFEETEKLDTKLIELNKEIREVNLGFAKMIEACPHEIIFKLIDNHPRKKIIDGKYYCPACGKSMCIYNEEQIKETVFKNSKIIPLTNLSLLGTTENYRIIRNEVISNLDFYYNPNTSIEEMSNRVESILIEKEYDYLTEKRLIMKKSNSNK